MAAAVPSSPQGRYRWAPSTPTENTFGVRGERAWGWLGRRRAGYHSPAAMGLTLSCFLSCAKCPRDEELKAPSGDCTSECAVLAQPPQLCHWLLSMSGAVSQPSARGEKCGSGSAPQDAANVWGEASAVPWDPLTWVNQSVGTRQWPKTPWQGGTDPAPAASWEGRAPELCPARGCRAERSHLGRPDTLTPWPSSTY